MIRNPADETEKARRERQQKIGASPSIIDTMIVAF
jgi:hypothetical protein